MAQLRNCSIAQWPDIQLHTIFVKSLIESVISECSKEISWEWATRPIGARCLAKHLRTTANLQFAIANYSNAKTYYLHLFYYFRGKKCNVKLQYEIFSGIAGRILYFLLTKAGYKRILWSAGTWYNCVCRKAKVRW